MTKQVRLDEWMDELDPQLLEEIGNLDESPLSRVEQKKLTRMVMGRIRKPRRWRRIALVAAALVALSTATAAAVGDLGLFDRYFTGGTSQMAGMAAFPEVSDEADGYRVELLGLMGDDQTVNLIFDLIGAEGEVLPEDVRFYTSHIWVEQGSCSMGWHLDQIEDDDPADNQARFMLRMDTDRKMKGKTVSLVLDTLQKGWSTEEAPEFEDSILSDASWTLTFDWSWQDLGQKLSLPAELDKEVKEVYLSPVSLRVDISGRNNSIQPPLIHMKNGEVLTMEELSSISGTTSEFLKIQQRWQFDRILDLKEVEAVEVNGTLIPV